MHPLSCKVQFVESENDCLWTKHLIDVLLTNEAKENKLSTKYISNQNLFCKQGGWGGVHVGGGERCHLSLASPVCIWGSPHLGQEPRWAVILYLCVFGVVPIKAKNKDGQCFCSTHFE